MSLLPPNQVEDDVKDMVYQIAGLSPILSSPIHRGSPLRFQMRFRFFDRNDRRLKNMVYQIARIAFFIREIPNQVGNDSFLIFIVILTHIMSSYDQNLRGGY